jgi:cleavage and polyadenylation specificity factor subunit 2
VRLSQLKQALMEAGVSSEWSGGALVCRGRVMVKHAGADSGELLLEGALSEDYYKIRDVLYAQYHVC